MPPCNRRRPVMPVLVSLWTVVFGAVAWAQTARPPVDVQYEVGVNYHATTRDFGKSAFIRQYHVPAVRATVIDQLQGMASAGANVVKTTLWLVGRGNESWRLSFPLAEQELANIEAYARDVASTRRPDGGHLRLQFTLAWLGCADYTAGSPEKTVGLCRLTWGAFMTRAQASIDALIERVRSVERSDGRKVVSTIYLDLEVMIGAKPNQDQFLRDLYPYFLAQTAAAGIDGSIYFLIPADVDVLDDDYEDADHPEVSGRISLYWLYRSIHFLRSAGLPVPERLDFSFFPRARGGSFTAVVNRVFSDLHAVFPNTRATVAETFYFTDDRRVALGQAFARSFLARGVPEAVVFWTTPAHEGSRSVGPPFDIQAFQLTVPPGAGSITASAPVCGLHADEVTCESTVDWSTSIGSATAAVWVLAEGGPPSLLACGKNGQASLSYVRTDGPRMVSLWATPWCEAGMTTQAGIQLATVNVATPPADAPAIAQEPEAAETR